MASIRVQGLDGRQSGTAGRLVAAHLSQNFTGRSVDSAAKFSQFL